MRGKIYLLNIMMIGCVVSLLIGGIASAAPGGVIFGSLSFHFSGGRPVGMVMYNDILLRNPQVAYQIPPLSEISEMHNTTAPWAQRIDPETGNIRGDSLIFLSNPGNHVIEVEVVKYDSKGHEECLKTFVIKPYASYFRALRQIFKNCP